MDTIRSELSKPSIRDWLGSNVKINVWKLSATRAWRNHMPGLGVKLEGGLLRDDTGNHLFISLLRRDVPESLARRIGQGSYRGVTSGNDVVTFIKKHICDESLSQDPLLVLTERREPNNHAPAKAAEWRKLARDVVQAYGPKYQKAADYLVQLADNQLWRDAPLEQLVWHERVLVAPPAAEPRYIMHDAIIAALAPAVPLKTVWQRTRQQ
eukprot:s5416_g2.t1